MQEIPFCYLLSFWLRWITTYIMLPATETDLSQRTLAKANISEQPNNMEVQSVQHLWDLNLVSILVSLPLDIGFCFLLRYFSKLYYLFNFELV